MKNPISIVTIKTARSMGKARRRKLAAWLRKQAMYLERNHAQMTDGRYTARFFAEVK